MGFRIEVDGIGTRVLADQLVEKIDPYRATHAGLTVRVLDTLDTWEADEFPTREAP